MIERRTWAPPGRGHKKWPGQPLRGAPAKRFCSPGDVGVSDAWESFQSTMSSATLHCAKTEEKLSRALAWRVVRLKIEAPGPKHPTRYCVTTPLLSSIVIRRFDATFANCCFAPLGHTTS